MHKFNYVIIFVSDMQRSIAFYRDVLGLAVKFETPHWTEFATGETTIALHPAELPSAATRTGDKAPAGVCQPGLSVDDVDAYHKAIVAKGAKCIREPTDEGFGVKLGLYADPDGLCFGVAQRTESRKW